MDLKFRSRSSSNIAIPFIACVVEVLLKPVQNAKSHDSLAIVITYAPTVIVERKMFSNVTNTKGDRNILFQIDRLNRLIKLY